MEPYLEDEEVSDQLGELSFNRQKCLRYFTSLFSFSFGSKLKKAECSGIVHVFCIFVLFLYFRLKTTYFQEQINYRLLFKKIAIVESIMVSFYQLSYESIVKYG